MLLKKLIELPYFIDDTKFEVNLKLPYESFEKENVAFGLGVNEWSKMHI